MTDKIDFEALGRRLVACPHWRWAEGMLTTCGGRVLGIRGDWLLTAQLLAGTYHGSIGERAASTCLPDLDDAGTLGCIEHAVIPFAWDDRDMYLARIDCTPAHSNVAVCWRWTVIRPSARGSVCGLYGSKAEALVAALEAAAAHAANSSVTTTGNPTS